MDLSRMMGAARVTDTAETVIISSLALLKMLQHARAGIPLEVMGLMLGQMVDEFTIHVVDVFAMPQKGTTVSIESVDPVYQQQFLERIKLTGRQEPVVGWYHSHPGFGCWLSGTDQDTQRSFEKLDARTVAVVVDPIQSVKGKVVIDAFRCVPEQFMMTGQESRQTTSVIGHLNKPSAQAVIHGLNRTYYSMFISYRRNELEERMLQNLHKRTWSRGLALTPFRSHSEANAAAAESILKFAKSYVKRVAMEEGKTAEEVEVANVGKQDPKRHLEQIVADVMTANIVQCLGAMLDSVVF